MIITKVNGNEIEKNEVEVSYEDVIKTMFVIPVVANMFENHNFKGATIEDVVEAVYDSIWHNDSWIYEYVNDGIIDIISEVAKENDWEIEG